MLLRSARKTARSRVSELDPQAAITSPLAPCPVEPPSALQPAAAVAPAPAAAPPPPPFRVQFDGNHVATIFTPLKILLVNDTQSWVLYKLQTNMPQRYRVLPEPFGVIGSMQKTEVEIHVNVEEDVVMMVDPQALVSTEEPAPSGRSRSPTRRSSMPGNDDAVRPPQRSRSASKSLASLLRYRPRECAEDISAESQAAIAPLRHAKRASLLARRNSDVLSREDHMITRRTLQMSFISSLEHDASDLSFRDSGVHPDAEGLPDLTVTQPNGTTRASSSARLDVEKRHLDMIRVEARTIVNASELMETENAESLATSRDLHRTTWAALQPGLVEMVPIRSEPVRRSEFARILSSAEPVGVQLLREEKEELQCNLRALQREHDFQESHFVSLSNSQACDRISLMEELNTVKTSIIAASQQVCVHEQNILMDDERAARSMITAESWNTRTPLLLACAEELEELYVRQRDEEAARLEKLVKLQEKFGNNPFPRDVGPLDFLHVIHIPMWLGLVSMFAALWSSLLAPLLLGPDYL